MTRFAPILLVVALLPSCAPAESEPDRANEAPEAAEAPAAPEASEASGALAAASPTEGLPLVRVWKSPTCGCCAGWVEHVKAAGYPVEVHDVGDLTPIKAEHEIAAEHRACHTATVDGYVLEGHVPADLMARMLEERPDIRGLAVPGMPVGSPGMEVGDRKDAYDVLALGEGGSVTVYARR